MKAILPKLLLGFGLLLLLLELLLRFGWGIGNPPLYIADPDFEYIYAPNQNITRRGNRVITNARSMRSHPLRKDDRLRIMKIGDSVIHGGGATDHDSLASSRLEHTLSEHFQENIRVLNVSAGSWGPDNALAYLNRFGHFDSKILVMVFSSHDLKDRMTHYPIVGLDPGFPSQRPLLALQEIWDRKVAPKLKGEPEYDESAWNKLIRANADTNEGWQGLIDYGQSNAMEIIVYLHPTQQELKAGEFDTNGKYLLQWLNSQRISVLTGFGQMKGWGYRDDIHLNSQGQAMLYQGLLEPLKSKVASQLNVKN